LPAFGIRADCAKLRFGGDCMATVVASAEPVRRWRLRLPERLPSLKGKGLTFYTIIWAILLPIAVVGSVRGIYIVMTIPSMWTPYGISTTEDSHGIHVDAVLSPVSRAAGLKADDYVVAVDGWRVPRVAARASARPRVLKPDGAQTIFTLQRPSGETYKARLTRSNAIAAQAYEGTGVSPTVAKLANLVGALLVPGLFIPAAILLFIRRRREAVPALLSIAFLMFAAMFTASDQQGVDVRIVYLFQAVATCVMFAALFAFPSGVFEPRWTAVPFLLVPGILLVPPDSTTVGSVLAVVLTLLAVAALVSRYRKAGMSPERLQLRWAFLGLVVGTLFIMLASLAQAAVAAWQADDPRWVVWQYAFVNSLATVSLCAMALGLLVSILRYRLYDADAVIGRSAAYGVLTLGFVALFATSEKLIELLGQQYLGQSAGGLAGGVAAAMAAVAIAPMHARSHRWAERRFQKGLYHLRHGLPPLVGDLRETSGLEQIAGATLDGIVEGVRTCRAALFAGGTLIDARYVAAAEAKAWWHEWTPPERNGLDRDPSDPVFPVRVPLEAEGHGRVGWLLLGPRPDGTLFGKSEYDAIEEIAEPVARAVQVALHRQEREDRYEQRFEALEKLVARLRDGPA
jgi:hypothetical protein